METKAFYVTMIRGKRVAKLAGPFDSHQAALDMVAPAVAVANDVDAASWFDAFGTAGYTAEQHAPGVLNSRLGLMVAS